MNKLNWHSKTHEMMMTKAPTIEQIANATGLHAVWLKRFKEDKIKWPDVNRVNTLHDYLRNRK